MDVLAKCFYCERMDLKLGGRKILQKLDIVTSRKIIAASCLPCSNKIENQFTMGDLSEFSKVPVRKLHNYPCIQDAFSAFSKNIPDSQKKDIVIGLTDKCECKMCGRFFEFTKSVEDHNTERHSNYETAKCTSGCDMYYQKKCINYHDCSILCPLCNESVINCKTHSL
ncbi:Hypothetical predicted protein [Cloeon dipterum]|uniref:C2H2-type domain-containing protein n=1 Tax=Cloeon dipterum TaxID=197152 RepID=A0A8S1DKH0_9INSE|nr:Hypothetical predicted protein [Cloeon dipterum]